MIFRQLYEPASSTYTYLLGCPETRLAVLVDPVVETLERDLELLSDLRLQLACTLETHIHADHISAACHLRYRTGSKIACPAMDRIDCANIGVAEGRPLTIGRLVFQPLFTPGHTNTHHSYVVDFDQARVFTGDALLIDGCGRTDFQHGDAATLFRSVHEKIFSLPDDTLVYPAHDYKRRRVSAVAQERERNPRLGSGKGIEEFVSIMYNLKLPYPKKMDIAVPANRRCGQCPDDTPEALRRTGATTTQGVPDPD